MVASIAEVATAAAAEMFHLQSPKKHRGWVPPPTPLPLLIRKSICVLGQRLDKHEEGEEEPDAHPNLNHYLLVVLLYPLGLLRNETSFAMTIANSERFHCTTDMDISLVRDITTRLLIRIGLLLHQNHRDRPHCVVTIRLCHTITTAMLTTTTTTTTARMALESCLHH